MSRSALARDGLGPDHLARVARRVCFAGALVLPGAGAAAPVHAGPSGPAAAWRAAMEAGDLPALARLHGPETVAFPPGETEVRGADAIMKGYAELFRTYSVRVTFDEAHWIEQPPLVVSWGLTTLTLHPKAGGPDVVSRTRFTDAAVKVDGGWRYVVDHASARKGP